MNKLALSVGAGVVLAAAGMARAGDYAFADAAMLHLTEAGWGNSTVSVTDAPGTGVWFDINLPDTGDGKTGTKDDWPIHPDAGLGYDAGYEPGDPSDPHASPHDNVDISAWDGIAMRATLVSGPPGEFDLHLFMNTGLTGPSGYPASDPTNDTFWAGPWVSLTVGESKPITLDFDAAEAWNIADNKSPHTGGDLGLANGGTYAINARDRREVTSLGIEFADFDGDLSGGTVRLRLEPIPEPTSLLLLAGAAALTLRRRPT